MRSTSRRTMASPMPLPAIPSCSTPSRSKGWNRRSRCSALMPRPLSATTSAHSRRPARVRRRLPSQTRPPRRLYLTALVSRLLVTCSSPRGSAQTVPASRAGASTATPCCAASVVTHGRACAATVASATGWHSGARSAASTAASSSRSSISDSRCRPACRMLSTRAAWTSSRAWSRSPASTSAKPSTAFIGVRSSWLTRASSVACARAACSRRSRSRRSASATWRSVTSTCTPKAQRRPSRMSRPLQA